MTNEAESGSTRPERYPQVKNLKTLDALRARTIELGIRLPLPDAGVNDVAESAEPTTALASPVSFVDSHAGEFRCGNRLAILPMEGWDGTAEGAPTDLVRRRWSRFGESGASLVWAEATAILPEGRANPNQLVLNEATVDGFAELRTLLHPDQLVGLQLTHSGRYARPDADGPQPRTLYRHPILDDRAGADDSMLLSDDEIDELVAVFIDRAVLAQQAGFHFVDVKACHGYLGHEFLTAYDRPGRYGGDLAGRTRFLRSVVEGIRAAAPDLAVALRLSVFDLIPFSAGPTGHGVPESIGEEGSYRYAFGADEAGERVDLTETHELLDIVEELGIGLVSATAGSPYYCPHVQRPAYFPPSDGYLPPEDPLVGVARLLAATAELVEKHPNIVFVGSGYSYLQDWIGPVAEAAVATGGTTMVGLGRMALSYPHLPADILSGQQLDRGLVCRTFSDCTTAPRAGLISGCFPLDPHYKDHPQRVELTEAKRATRERLRR